MAERCAMQECWECVVGRLIDGHSEWGEVPGPDWLASHRQPRCDLREAREQSMPYFEFRRLIHANPLSAVEFARARSPTKAAQSARLPSSLSMTITISFRAAGIVLSCLVKDVATSPVLQVQPSKAQTSIQKFFIRRTADGTRRVSSLSAIQARPATSLPPANG